jgi:hypothetical protein
MPNPERSLFEDTFTEDDAISVMDTLVSLIQDGRWGVYEELLKASRIRAREAALDAEEKDFKFWKGYVEGLRAAAEMPRAIVQIARRQLEAEARREEKKTKVEALLPRLPAEEDGDPTF